MTVIRHEVAGLVLGVPEVAAGRRPLYAYLWPAGMVLAELVVSELAAAVSGRRVVELGCGLGAVGLAAARAGGDVLLCDAEADALALAAANARANGITVTTRLLDWGRVPESLIGGFDIVLGSDITYGRDELVPLLGAVAALLAPAGCAFLADPDRLSLEALEEAAAGAGLVVRRLHTVTAPPQLPTSDASEGRPVHVYRLDPSRDEATPGADDRS